MKIDDLVMRLERLKLEVGGDAEVLLTDDSGDLFDISTVAQTCNHPRDYPAEYNLPEIWVEISGVR
jgi:hypothetical protein